MKIFRDFRFEAAHRLPHVPESHRCHRLHGHNYRVRLICDGPLNEELGWVVDFAALDAVAEYVRSMFDHKYLNDVIENPTAELIAQWILERARLTVFPVCSVMVWENDDCGAIAE